MMYSIDWLVDMFQGLRRKSLLYDYCYKIVKSIDEHINREKIKLLYPRHLFLENKKFEIYTFTGRSIFISKAEDEDGNLISTEVLNIKDIKKVRMVKSGEYEPRSLEIFFNGEEDKITFNSKEDTNKPYLTEHNKAIGEIFKYLTGEA